MTHDEYERRKRRLEEELQAGVELLETAHRHQLRALQLVWAAMGGEGVEIPPPVVASAAVAVYTAAAPALPAPTEVSPARARRGPWELHNDVVDALDVLPDVFDRNDVCRVIGYEPDRGSLYRTFLDLKQEGALVVQKRGSGRSPTLYRKTIASDATAAE
ncbi:MAG: hypothetical protein JF614_23880 [Acidobacteria bacterium]|nr:hypothetical protein [Acidobacteriota bacterium]